MALRRVRVRSAAIAAAAALVVGACGANHAQRVAGFEAMILVMAQHQVDDFIRTDMRVHRL